MRAQSRGAGFGVSAFHSLFFSIIVSCMPTITVGAQQPSSEYVVGLEPARNSIDLPWQVGVFVAGGFPPYYWVRAPLLHYQEELQVYNVGLMVGRMMTAIHGPSFLRGRGEAVIDVIPYWQVYHPAQMVAVYLPGSNAPAYKAEAGEYSIHGALIAPFKFRWNFEKKDASRFVPWVQPGFGLLWTNRDFPQGYGTALKPPQVTTSHINFAPEVDLGESILFHGRQSIELSVQATHTTDFGLTKYDPGVNAIVAFRVGYSWRK